MQNANISSRGAILDNFSFTIYYVRPKETKFPQRKQTFNVPRIPACKTFSNVPDIKINLADILRNVPANGVYSLVW